MKRYFAIVLTLLLCAYACAAGAELQGSDYEYVPSLDKMAYIWRTEEYRFIPFDDNTAIIANYIPYIDEEEGVTLIIPEELEGYRVTEIGENAFEGCGAAEIVVPEGVKRIGEYAFHGASAFRIELPEGLETIGDYAFYRAVYLNQIDIPSGVTYIGDEAFSYTDLREITLPETELTLGSNPFANIEYLDDVYFSQQHPTLVKYDPQQILSRDDHSLISVINWGEGEDYSVTFSPETREIGDCAFKGCINLYDIHVPGTVKRIGDHAFFESYLIDVIIDEGVESIGEDAFGCCDLLKNVKIPASVTFIGDYAFDGSRGVILTVEPGSYAEAYARENEIPYVGATYDELDTDEIYARAKKLYDGKGTDPNYEMALYWFMIAAKRGDALAQHYVGLMYAKGQGVEKNFAEAIKWTRPAAEQGDMYSQYNLACYYTEEGVKDEAFKWYKLSAEQGFASAQYFLGLCYHRSFGVEEDMEEAVKWFRLAAENGNANGQWMLGRCYYDGDGVPVDRELAEKWIRSAAQQGQKDAKAFLESLAD